MPNFAGSKTQLAASRYICRASRPANTPARLAAWTAPQNYVLLFSQHLPADVSKKPRLPASSLPVLASKHLSGPIPYRALHFTTATTYLPAPAGQQPFAAYLSIPAASQPPASQQLPFRLDRPVHSHLHSFFFLLFSFFFFLFFLPFCSTQKKETGKAGFHLFFLQSQI